VKIAVVLDFETISKADLKVVGSSRYAEDPSTEVLCLSVDGHGTWVPGQPDGPLMYLAHNKNVLFVAHNAGFEKDIWRSIMVPRYGFPDVPNERWHCTLSVCAQKALPQDLDVVTKLLHLGAKDMAGSKYVKALNKQYAKTGVRPDVDLPVVVSYCEQDVRVEHQLRSRIGWLQPGERDVWLLDQRINERGIKIDLDYVRACRRIVKDATEPLASEFRTITGGLEFSQVTKVGDWVRAQGVSLPDLKKETIAKVLGHDIDGDDEEEEGLGDLRDSVHLPAEVRRALEIRQLVGSAAVKKLPRMEACICQDGRAHRLLQYHGALPGRWAGRIIQPQNFPRPTLTELMDSGDRRIVSVDRMVEALMTGDHEWVELTIGPAVEAVVQGLRHAIVAEGGRRLVSGDYAQIEARIVLCLAGQWDKVKLFETGTPYVDMASAIYKRPIDKKVDVAEYTIGKNTVLGCGFQMAWKTFRRRYCPLQTVDFAQEVIRNYREDWAPKVPLLWAALEEAAFEAVYSGEPREAYGIEYRLEGEWLTARLPSGRKLFYYKPTRGLQEMPWSTPERPDHREGWYYLATKNGQIRKVWAFGGHLTENAVQGLARDVLRDAMPKLEANGFPLVLTVHDEALGEPLAVNADELAFSEIMCDSADWVKALRIPIKCETWVGDRYRK
jgi:DNA polymerase